jgi:hypothetical protein
VRLIALWECASLSASDFVYKVDKGIWTSSVVSSQVLQKFMSSVDINTIDNKIMTYSFMYSVDVNYFATTKFLPSHNTYFTKKSYTSPNSPLPSMR